MNSINRLRGELILKGIGFENNDWPNIPIERIAVPSIRNRLVSIVEGKGTYGYEDDLLEIWDYGTMVQPKGYYTVEKAIEVINDALRRTEE